MIRIRAWHRWQGPVIHAVIRSRRSRNGVDPKDVFRPLSIHSVSVSARLDADFLRFAEILGRRDADALWLRVLQYAATTHAGRGDVPVARKTFAVLVLSRPWNTVKKSVGEAVYDALLESGLAEPLGSEWHSGNVSCYEPGCVACNVTSHVSRSGSRAAIPFRAVPIHPPFPPQGGQVAPLAQDGQQSDPAAPEEPPRNFRPRDRERLAAVLEYVLRCGTPVERDHARSLRERLDAGQIPEAENVALLEDRFRWVTRDKLARGIDGPDTPSAYDLARGRGGETGKPLDAPAATG